MMKQESGKFCEGYIDNKRKRKKKEKKQKGERRKCKKFQFEKAPQEGCSAGDFSCKRKIKKWKNKKQFQRKNSDIKFK